MLVQRLRRLPNIDPTMGEYLVFAQYNETYLNHQFSLPYKLHWEI